MSLLSIRNLQVGLQEGLEPKKIIKDFSLNIKENRVVALVGGSGSGKTMTALSILGLLPLGINIEGGEILFMGQNLLGKSSRRIIRKIRGKEISMVFQEPLSALNPVFSVGYQIEEVIKFHTTLRGRERKEKIWDLLHTVGMPEPKRTAKYYAHELSGGMRQRAMIALAIATDPRLIIADEPTSNLDVTLQAHIIELFRKLKNQLRVSILLITHDLGVVKQLADDIAVLYDGRVVEFNDRENIFSCPKHPYTSELIKAVTV